MAKRPPTARVEVKVAEALVVAPDELLVITIADGNTKQEFVDELISHFKQIGWADRVVVLLGGEITLGKVEAAGA